MRYGIVVSVDAAVCAEVCVWTEQVFAFHLLLHPFRGADGFDLFGCDVGSATTISISPGFGAVVGPFKGNGQEFELLDEVLDELADRIDTATI